MSLVVSADPIPLKTDADGVVRVGKSRVTLDTLVYAFRDGATAEEIVQQYSTLSLDDVYSVIGYYLRRRDEVNAYLAEREKFAADVCAENEIRHDPAGVRDRLLARRDRQG